MSSNNVHLRALEPEDLEFIYQLENEDADTQTSATNTPVSRYAAKRYLETTSNDLFADGELRLVIENTKGEAVGTIDLTSFNPLHARAEIGLTLITKFRGQHYAKPAVTALEAYARQLCLHQLYCIISTENQPAQHLFQQLGYTATATLPDWLHTPQGYSSATLFTKIIV